MHSGASVLEGFNGILGSMRVNGRSIKVKLLASSWTLCLGCYLSSQMNFKKTLCVKRNVSAEGLIVKTAKTII